MNSVEKTIQILNCLSEADGILGVTDISVKVSIPKSTVHRILQTLMKYSLVSKDTETSKYKLGIQLLRYSHSFYSSFDLRECSKNELKRICKITNLNTFLTILHNDNYICIDSISLPNNPYSYKFVKIGQSIPFHCTAAAKAIFANQPYDEISRVLKKNVLKKYTIKTITNKKLLLEHMEIIKYRGYALCDEEFEEGIRAVSAPIKNIDGKVVASITITGLKSRISNYNMNSIIRIVKDSAKNISNNIGGVIIK